VISGNEISHLPESIKMGLVMNREFGKARRNVLSQQCGSFSGE